GAAAGPRSARAAPPGRDHARVDARADRRVGRTRRELHASPGGEGSGPRQGVRGRAGRRHRGHRASWQVRARRAVAPGADRQPRASRALSLSRRSGTPMKPPAVLVLAGLDPSGGAGLLADVVAVRACGVVLLCVATALTVQAARAALRFQAVDAPLLVVSIRWPL